MSLNKYITDISIFMCVFDVETEAIKCKSIEGWMK